LSIHTQGKGSAAWKFPPIIKSRKMSMRRMRIERGICPANGPPGSGISGATQSSKTKFCETFKAFISLALFFGASNLFAAGACPVDTSQADFQLGNPTNVNLLGSGDVVLATSATVDQANTNLSANGFQFHTYWWFGQTFTAGVSGPLTAADIRMFCSSCTGTMPDLTVAIRATTTNPAGEYIPTGEDLATATIPGFTSGGGSYYKATFANPINMDSGTRYAVIVRANAQPTSGSYAYLVSADDPYSGGTRVTSTNSGMGWYDRPYDIGFRIYTGSGHVAAGDLVSSLKDSNPPGGSSPTWPSLSWGATTPGSTNLKFQAAASNSSSGPFSFVGPDGTAGTFFTASGAALTQFNGMRYLKYKALLSSSNPSATPTLKDATVCYDNVGGGSSADLQITKTDGASVETPGTAVSYTIVASNAGPSNVTAATVTDTFPVSLQSCGWTCSAAGGASCSASGSGNISQSVNLPAGGSTTFTASCTVSPSATGSLVNTASISSTVSDPVPGNNSATDSNTLTPSANLAITKTDGASVETPGTPVTYTIVASNAGPSNVTSATVTDSFTSTLQSCTWTCSGASGGSCATPSGSGNINHGVNLPVSGSATFTASCNISASATGSLANTASISSAVSDPTPGNNSATDTDTLTGSANLGISKTNGVSSSTPGGQTTYTIVASNAGPSNVSSATVADTFSSNHQNCSWTCSGSGGGSCAASGNGNISQSVNLPVGASTTFTAVCGIKTSATGSLVNTATISSTTADPVAGNNSATDTDTLGASADLKITLDNEDNTVIAGTSVIYTIVASNSGPSTVSNATVTDVFSNKLENCEWMCEASAGSSCAAAGAGNINQSVNLPAQGAATFTAICDVDADATGTLQNTASISSAISDPVAANNSATDTASLSYLADLSITSSSATAGGTVSYSIIASNAGSSTADQVTVQNTFPPELTNCSWTCQASAGAICPASGTGHINHIVTLPRGSQVNYSATCNVAPEASGTLVNTAAISSGIDDPDMNNNQAIDTIQLDAKEELIFKSGFD
jgi:uncharacterized repeat protein (TIGR01451 family)